MEDLTTILPPIHPDEDDYIQHKIRSAKRAARSELSVSRGEWAKHNHAKSDILSIKDLKDDVPRIHTSDLNPQYFVEKFELPRVPVVITGLTDSWAVNEQWTPKQLMAKFKDHKFKVGSDDDGYAVRLRLEHFLRYCCYPHHAGSDDSPLYIFDGTFADRSGSTAMTDHYKVPDLFQDDLFKLVGERRRPPYRWFVMGPARSGSGLHVDPLSTSAWNALLFGHKRWALYPPGTPREHLLPKGVEREAVSWFSNIYPKTTQVDWPYARPVSIIQRPGETVYVPNGWWHAVLNLNLTIAVTHNYVSRANFSSAWRHTCKGRPKMSVKWLAALRQQRPELAAIAEAIEKQGDKALSHSSSSSSSSSSSGSSSHNSSGNSSDDQASYRQSKRQKLTTAAAAAITDNVTHVQAGKGATRPSVLAETAAALAVPASHLATTAAASGFEEQTAPLPDAEAPPAAASAAAVSGSAAAQVAFRPPAAATAQVAGDCCADDESCRQAKRHKTAAGHAAAEDATAQQQATMTATAAAQQA